VASLPPHNLHTQSPRVDQFRDVCDHHYSYPHDVCSYCQSFDHDVNSYPIVIYPMKHMLDLMP